MKKMVKGFVVYEAEMILGKGIALKWFVNKVEAERFAEMMTAKNEDPAKEYFVKAESRKV